MSLRFNFAINPLSDTAVTAILKTKFGNDVKTELAMEALVYNYTNFAIQQGISNLAEEAKRTGIKKKTKIILDKNLSYLEPILERENHRKSLTDSTDQLKKVLEKYSELAHKLRK